MTGRTFLILHSINYEGYGFIILQKNERFGDY
jgi:hypothetical protein